MSTEKKMGMKAKDYEETLDELRLKISRGEKLDRREERLYAYRNVGRCKCGVRR